jgi:hypothetical protein
MKTLLTLSLLLALSACAKTVTGPVLGLGLTYAGDQLTGAQVVGQTKSMDECRKLAKAALASVPIPAGTKLGCAQVEIQ